MTSLRDAAALVAMGQWSGTDAAVVLFEQSKAKVAPDRMGGFPERLVNVLEAAVIEAQGVRRLFWPDAIALIRRGLKAKASSKRLLQAVERLARARSGGGEPLGCGLFAPEELSGLVSDEIAAWVAARKVAA